MTERRFRRARWMLGAGASGAALLLAACDDSEPSPVQTASRELGAMDGTSFEETARATFEAAEASLRGESGPNASQLTAEAQFGLATLAMSEAAQLSRRASDDFASVIKLELATWESLQLEAVALESFDGAAERATIEDQMGERRRETDDAQAHRDSLAEELESLLEDVAEQMASARVERERESELRLQASNVGLSATARARLIEEASGFRARATGFETQGALLQAEADALRPFVDEADRTLDRLRNQRRLLEAELEALAGRIEGRQQFAAQRRADAAEAGAQARAQVAPMVAMVDDAVDRWKEASAGFASASRDRAVSDRANQGQVGLATQMSAELTDHIALVRRLVDAGLADDRAISGTLDGWAEALRTAGEAAAGVAAMSGQGMDPIATDPGSTGAPVGEEAAVAVAFQDLMASVSSFDAAGVRAGIRVDDPALSQALDDLLSMFGPAGRIDRALQDQFGVTLMEMSERVGADAGADDDMGMGGMGGADLTAMLADLSNWKPEIMGDGTARMVLPLPDDGSAMGLQMLGAMFGMVDPAGGGLAVPMVRSDDVWRLDVGSMIPAEMMPMIQPMLAGLGQMGDAMNGLADRLEAGEFATLEQFDAEGQRVMDEISASMAPPTSVDMFGDAPMEP